MPSTARETRRGRFPVVVLIAVVSRSAVTVR